MLDSSQVHVGLQKFIFFSTKMVKLAVCRLATGFSVVQVSLVAGLDPKVHYDIGKALSPLRAEEVLILCSGGAVHNLMFSSALGSQLFLFPSVL